MLWLLNYNPPASKASREEANLTEGKNLQIHVYGIKEFVTLSVCLSVCPFIISELALCLSYKNIAAERSRASYLLRSGCLEWAIRVRIPARDGEQNIHHIVCVCNLANSTWCKGIYSQSFNSSFMLQWLDYKTT